jgi:hypothetical protein
MPPRSAIKHRTVGDLFGPPRQRAHQLGLGQGFARKPTRCTSCGHELGEARDCIVCGAFTCAGCDTLTTANGGNGTRCYRCLA